MASPVVSEAAPGAPPPGSKAQYDWRRLRIACCVRCPLNNKENFPPMRPAKELESPGD